MSLKLLYRLADPYIAPPAPDARLILSLPFMVLFGEELFPHVLDKFEVFPRELGPELGFEYEFNLYDALEGRLWCPLLIPFGVLGLDRNVSK